jgi:hypothetical protein
VQFINPGPNFDPGVYWVLPDTSGSATLGTTSAFQGNILAQISIGLNHGATIGCGRALAATGAVTLDANTIAIGCNGSLSVDTGSGGAPVVVGPGGIPLAAVPEPGTLLLLGTGIAGALAIRKMRLRSAI